MAHSRALRCAIAVLGLALAAPAADRPPLEIKLERTPGPGLRAVLKNTSAEEQLVLRPGGNLEPSDVVVMDVSGNVLEPFETRAELAPARLRREDFGKLAAGAEAVLLDVQLARRGDGWYELLFGTRRIELPPAARYHVKIAWRATASYFDAANKPQTLAGAWTGTVRSNTVDITLE